MIARLGLTLVLGLGLAVTASAQEASPDAGAASPDAPSTLPTANEPPEHFVSATGGKVRVLDKLTGAVTDLDLQPGAAQRAGRLAIVLNDCRYPADTPASEAYAHLTITDDGGSQPLFNGWMIASSPALSALDHPRYDVWVLVCDLPKD